VRAVRWASVRSWALVSIGSPPATRTTSRVVRPVTTVVGQRSVMSCALSVVTAVASLVVLAPSIGIALRVR
jgi:hypothetical protein